jgi:LysM repeat protein
MATDLQPGEVLYTVQPGDNLSAIAERFYGDPTAFRQILEANLGRGQPRGQTLRDARFIYPGWQLVVPDPTQAVYTDPDGKRWYTVRAGDTLSGISARLLGDAQRYPELFADNQGVELGDGHVLTNPNLIWPGLHLRLPFEPRSEDAVEPPSASQPSPAPATTTSSTPTSTVPESSGQPTAPDKMNSNGVDTTVDAHMEPTPSVVPPPIEMPVRPASGDEAPAQWPSWVPGDAKADLLVAGGLTAAALLAAGARRRRRTPPEPESETRVDVHAFTLAEPAAVAASRTAGTAGDPHGIVLGELLAGELLRHARVAELASVRVISVIAGRSESVVTLSTSLEDRPLLEAALRTETQLARRIDVSRSQGQDVVVRLQGVRQEALARVSVQDCPVLLCVGMLPDSRSYLVSWQALGHVLAAAQPGTTDAEEHLAGLLATLAGQLAPSDLHLYTVAGSNTWLRQLAPLPHQRAVADPADPETVAIMLGSVRTELERRQLAGDGGSQPELVLVASELADVRASEDLTHLLSHGHRFGVHVVAATCDGDVEREPLVDLFSSHLVFGLEDEEASTRLLGTPWALTLAEPGRVLVRVGQRKEVEALGLHLTEQGRLELLASMGVADPASATGQFADALERAPDSAHEVMAGSAEEARKAPPEPTTETSGEKSDVADVQTQTQSAPDSMATVAETTVERAESNRQPERADKPTGSESNVDHDDTRSHKSTAVAAASGRPERIRKLLERTQLVVDCEEASVWSARGRLGIGQSSPVEVLLYVAAAPLLHQGRLAEWSGVKPETLLAEIWAPRARDPDNRDSAQTWLGKNLGRLQDEIGGATGGLDAQMIVKRQGGLYLNEDIVVSDVEAFMAALERARAAQGPDQIKATEEVFALRTSGLLSRVVRKPRTAGPKVE